MKIIKIIALTALILFTGLVNAGQVSINTSDASKLALELNGIGVKKAQAIIDYRKKNGPFTTIDELEKVKGISAKTIEKNRKHMTL